LSQGPVAADCAKDEILHQAAAAQQNRAKPRLAVDQRGQEPCLSQVRRDLCMDPIRIAGQSRGTACHGIDQDLSRDLGTPHRPVYPFAQPGVGQVGRVADKERAPPVQWLFRPAERDQVAALLYALAISQYCVAGKEAAEVAP
jgi:hypothetical protein